MKKKLLIVFLFAIVAISTSPFILANPLSSKLERGSQIQTENRDLKGFSKIETSGPFEIRIIKSDVFAVKVEANDDVIKNIITVVEGDKLVIKMDKNTKNNYDKGNQTRQITIQLPSLNSVSCSGATEITSDDIFDAEKFELKTSGASEVKLGVNAKLLISKYTGASEVRLKGKVDTHALEMTGAAELEAVSLEVSKYAIQTKGASDCKIFVTDELAISGSGASSIKYKGSPSKITKDTRGATDVSKL